MFPSLDQSSIHVSVFSAKWISRASYPGWEFQGSKAGRWRWIAGPNATEAKHSLAGASTVPSFLRQFPWRKRVSRKRPREKRRPDLGMAIWLVLHLSQRCTEVQTGFCQRWAVAAVVAAAIRLMIVVVVVVVDDDYKNKPTAQYPFSKLNHFRFRADFARFAQIACCFWR